MESPILKQIAKFLQDKKKYKRWLAVFVCLAVVVGFATTAALKMRGKAMTHDERVLNCKLQVHQHAETCYDQEKNIICGYADYVVHKHNDDCYDPHNGNLVCALPEVEAHQHTDECYQEQQALACGLEESEGHQHTEECRTKEQGELTCQAEEHTHTEECQAEDGAFSCGKEEHTHADECYQWTETLTCGQEESEGHHHTEACNQVQKTLVCQRPEIEVHTHGDECYQRVLITPEGEEIVQDPKDNTGVAQEVLAGTANKEVPEGRIEVRRSCGKLQAEEHTHTQENGCIEIREVLDGSDLRPVEEEPAEGNTETAGNGNENQEGNPENGQTPMDGTEEEQTIVKTFEGDGFKVIAEYKKDANIPEEAELKAEQITAEDDAEHYAEREAASKESIGDENATAKALLKIGFYVGEQEVEPETPVSVTVQLLDEKGLPEGAPITVVHFTEDGAEKIEGSKAESDSTTFEVNQFCEFMLLISDDDDTTNKVRENEDGTTRMALDKIYSVKTKDFKYAFHIVGDIELPEGAVVSEEETPVPEGTNGENKTTPDKGNAGVGEGGETSAPEGTDEEGTTTPNMESSEGSVTSEGETSDSEDGKGEETSEEGNGETTSQEGQNSGLGESGETSAPEVESENDAALSEDAGFGGNEEDAGIPKDNTQIGEASEPENTEQSKDVNESEDVTGNELENDNVESGKIETGKKLKLVTEVLGETSKEYKAGVSYVEENTKGEVLALQAISYTLMYEEKEIDISDCKVKVTVTPVSRASSSDVESNIEVLGLSDDDGEKIVKSAVQGDKKVEFYSESKEMVSLHSEVANPEFTVQYYANLERTKLYDAFKINGSSSAGYTIQDKTEEPNVLTVNNAYRDSITRNYLPFIDTRNPRGEKDVGGIIPQNSNTIPCNVTVYIENGKVETEKQLTEVYQEKKYNYIKAPSMQYFNVLVDNAGYVLKEIWVLKEGVTNSSSTNEKDWDIYKELNSIHFTNRKDTVDKNKDPKQHYILLDDNTVIRMVYDTAIPTTRNNPAVFYDYDISEQVETNGNVKTMLTEQAGINNEENYQNTSGGKYAFGNANTGVKLQDDRYSDGNNSNSMNRTNQWNEAGKKAVFAGCTFGLVKENDGENLKFNVNAPKIFGDDSNDEKKVIGRTRYAAGEKEKFSLNFNRVGDTYTLSSVEGTGATNLDSFEHPRCGSKTHSHIMTNNFWPMDNDTHTDVKFNEQVNDKANENYKFKGKGEGTLPVADDGIAHNCYFGMYYTVDFDLDKSYVGPLEYLFYGDDDMWVFLKDSKGNQNLVCDIGGVHSSVGEIVNLWDWINPEKLCDHKNPVCYDEGGNLICKDDLCDHKNPNCYNKEGNLTCKENVYTLSFFYTERGASGSSCWMQFTLPSVSSMTPETSKKDYGQLKVEKKVVVSNENYKGFDVGQDTFKFRIELTNRTDDYRYTKYSKGEDGSLKTESGLVLWDGADFTLKHNEYIIVNYLPTGTQYKITEYNTAQSTDGTVSPNDYSTDITLKTPDDQNPVTKGEDLTDNKEVSGDIPQDAMDEVLYINKFLVFGLPKTGGEGTILYTMAGVAVILLGAGFMYRKKFREGRVGGSS